MPKRNRVCALWESKDPLWHTEYSTFQVYLTPFFIGILSSSCRLIGFYLFSNNREGASHIRGWEDNNQCCQNNHSCGKRPRVNSCIPVHSLVPKPNWILIFMSSGHFKTNQRSVCLVFFGRPFEFLNFQKQRGKVHKAIKCSTSDPLIYKISGGNSPHTIIYNPATWSWIKVWGLKWSGIKFHTGNLSSQYRCRIKHALAISPHNIFHSISVTYKRAWGSCMIQLNCVIRSR